jgi:molecular chaperone DnaK (HSP70)
MHHERYLAIQKEREAEKPKESYAEKEKRLLDSNTKQQERVKRAIARVEEEIAKKTPGTLRELKKYRKELQEELRTIKICRGTLYNGGIW